MSLLKVAGTTASSGQLYVDSVFSVYLYTGTGATQTITNGIDLAGKGGMVWLKSRSGAYYHNLFDTNRGINNRLFSNDPSGANLSTDQLTAFNSNGFTLGVSSNQNISSDTYASWTFRKAAKFFDVVTYTGTGSARTIAHSLGVAPGMVIVKRTDTTSNWQVYHNGLTSAAYSIQLNLTAAQASAPTVWNSTAPTSSVFSVGTDSTVNASGGTYVAYLYAHDTSSTGIIQCGSFTTDGSGNFNVNLGWEPQYVMIKHSNTVSSNVQDNWIIYDTMRGFVTQSGSGERLYPNLSNAAANGNDMGPTATGFESKGNMLASQTFIYMAIRRPNKPPTTGTQVYLPSTYTGSNSVNQVINTGFTVDMTWARARNTAVSMEDYDRLRGNTVRLSTDLTDGEISATALYFDLSNSVSLRAGYDLNYSTFNFIAYNFKRAPGFFDEVCYTGTGSTTIQAHNLGVAPELIIVKSRSASYPWVVWHNSFSSSQYLNLNSSNAIAQLSTGYSYLATYTPTSSAFYPSTGLNGTDLYPFATTYNGGGTPTYVAYLFATLAGISKVGSYTGNGTSQVIACGFSAGARFVLIKRTDSTGDWYTFDSARGLTSSSSPYLLLNSTAAEVTGNNGVYASTGGFTLDSTASTTTNINAATYIFLAVA